jgi:hypothetical protein
MLDFMRLTQHAPWAIRPGAHLHRAALAALHGGRYQVAERLFESAALRYRRELEVEPLARLRVHQLMAHVLAHPDSDSDVEACLEVERRLCLLESIESLEPPFARVDARTMLGNWIQRGSSAGREVAADSMTRAA